jgi:hypothetical protein
MMLMPIDRDCLECLANADNVQLGDGDERKRRKVLETSKTLFGVSRFSAGRPHPALFVLATIHLVSYFLLLHLKVIKSGIELCRRISIHPDVESKKLLSSLFPYISPSPIDHPKIRLELNDNRTE